MEKNLVTRSVEKSETEKKIYESFNENNLMKWIWSFDKLHL